MSKKISKENIIKALQFFIQYIEKNDFNWDVLGDIDYYWDIVDSEKLYNPYEENIQDYISLWQISDDWDRLWKLIDNNSNDELIFYDFKRLWSIIRILAYAHAKRFES